MKGLEDKSIEMKDVFFLNERIFSLVGVWPLEPNYVKFGFTAIYIGLQVVMQFAKLIELTGNLEFLIQCLMEWTVVATTYCMIFMVRYTKQLPQIILLERREIAQFQYENIGEAMLYYSYNRFSWRFGKIIVGSVSATAVLIYVRPLATILRAGAGARNKSESYELPIHINVFFDYSDLWKYVLVYLYEFPMLYVAFLHISTISLIVNVVLHISGRMTVLAYRIRNLTSFSQADKFNHAIVELVQVHLNILRLGKAINSTFSFILLVELGEISIRLALSMYILSTVDISSVEVVSIFIMYVVIMFLILYCYCYVGEEWIQACNDVQNAYFDCNWYALPNNCKKLLLICMICGQKPLNITAGGYYVFSLYGFTNLIKSCLAYVSLLQTIV